MKGAHSVMFGELELSKSHLCVWSDGDV